jgi:hypothetical protein
VDFPDRDALVIAQEVSANEFIREPLPGEPIRLENYPQLPPNEDIVTRYMRLVRDRRQRTEHPEGTGSESMEFDGFAQKRPVVADRH